MARFYYQINHEEKVLYIVNQPEVIPDEVIKQGDVAKLTKEGTLVGYNLFGLELSEPLGMVVAPKQESIEKINAALVGAGFAPIEAPKDSLYHVVEVKNKEEHPLDERSSILTLADGQASLSTVTRYQNIEIGNHIVVALDNCQKFDGTIFHKKVVRNIPIECEVCSAADLKVGEEGKAAYLVNDLPAGSDFFLR